MGRLGRVVVPPAPGHVTPIAAPAMTRAAPRLIALRDLRFGREHLGLKSVGGKRERYESLLRKFAGRQAGAVDAIRTALSVGDTSTAERDAHSLKGAASTLGATALAEHAALAEIAIKTGQSADEALAAAGSNANPNPTAIERAQEAKTKAEAKVADVLAAVVMVDSQIQCAHHSVISAAIVCSANVRPLIQVAVAVETVVVQVITRMAVVVVDGVAHARTS